MDTGLNSKDAIKLQEENQRLKSAVQELFVLNEISTAISSTQTVDHIIELIVHKCVKHLGVEQGVVMLLNSMNYEKPFQTMIRRLDSDSNILPLRLNDQLTGWMLKNKSPLLINDLAGDTRFNLGLEAEFPVKSLLSVPLIVKGNMTGLLTVFNKKSEHGFTKNDQKLLDIIAAQSAQVIETARLYQEERALLHLREEMRMAHQIQSDLLPKSNPEIKGYQIAGKSIAAAEVGGDYYDFITIDKNRTALCVADISGKGVPAAILMANLQASLRGQTKQNKSCRECVSFTNDILFHNTAANKFATLFYAILNTDKNELTYCNAGHNPPFLISEKNKSKELTAGGVVAGIAASFPFTEVTITFYPDDLLVIYSDGITEAMNRDEEEFGEERLKTIIEKNRHAYAENLIEIIFDAVKAFSKNVSQSDDMTLVVIKRNM